MDRYQVPESSGLAGSHIINAAGETCRAFGKPSATERDVGREILFRLPFAN